MNPDVTFPMSNTIKNAIISSGKQIKLQVYGIIFKFQGNKVISL